MTRHKKTGPVTPARDRGPALLSTEQSNRASRTVVPQLTEIARLVPTSTLELMRGEARPGERVAIYQRGRTVRVLITGECRRYTLPPALLEGWRRLAVVEITEDGERVLPEVVS